MAMSKIDIPDPAQHYFVCGTEACGEMNNAGMNIRRTKTPRSAKQSLTVNADFILLKKKYATPNSTNKYFTKSTVLRNHLILLTFHVIVSV